ncbi:hypothetical protein YN1_0020 [Nanoarchaeota archaeon]
MKSQSWIEVLITLAVFIYIFIYIYHTLVEGLVTYSNGMSQFISYQKLYLASYYYSKYLNPVEVYNYIGISFSAYYYPSVIFVSNNPYICNNCVEVYYNIYNNQINIIQNSNVNLTTYLSFFVFDNNYSLSVSSSDSSINCNNYYNVSVYDIYYRSLVYCNSYLYGNSTINITTNENILFITNYISILKMYNGNKIISEPKLLNLQPSSVTSLQYVLFFNNSIEDVYLYI